jgi:predicted NAD-dependent protein-ADP-ribosyltransferase YbiA (DUF1768 family)
MNVGKGKGYPSSALSNFAAHPFVIDGVECASMEGFLQALKFDKFHIQVEVCKLVGLKAKYRGKKRNKAWKSKQTLWWQGQEFDRHGREYQQLLDRAYKALSQNDGFKKALLASGDAVFTHSIGSNKKSNTVLTESEFCSRLMKTRARLLTEGEGE